jgi:hypothetical protein
VTDQYAELWDLLPHPEGSTVRWFAKGDATQTGGYADTLAELVSAIAWTPKMNFYVAPNPTDVRHGTRHSTADVTHWSWFFVDIDPVGLNPVPELAAMQALALLSSYWKTLLAPTVIDSGRGIQMWFRLQDEPLDDQKRRDVRVAQRYWLDRLSMDLGEYYGCRVDTTTSDLPRLMRCPGTVNMKTGRRTFIRDHGSPHLYLGGTIMGIDPKYFQQVTAPMPEDVHLVGKPWQLAIPHLTIKAQSYLLTGAVEPGRHSVMWHTARCLAERGITIEQTRAALTWANGRRGEENELTPKDIEHALDTAYKGVDNVYTQ